MNLLKKKKPDVPRRRLVETDIKTPASSSDIFRRNRTLTGTTSNNFGSVNAKTDLESSRKHAHHLVRHRRKVLSVLTIVLLSAAILWILISNFTATVIISVSNVHLAKPVDSSRYVKVIQDYLDANPISRLHFNLDQVALTNYVSTKLPEVSNVTQQYMLGIGETGFAVTLRTPVAGWKIGDKQYYVDSKGISFDQNYLAAPDVQIIDNSGASPQGSTAVISNRFLSFVGRVVSLAATNGYTVSQAVLPANTTRELVISVKESSTLVKLSIDRLAGEQIEDMSKALKYFASHGQSPEYIDIRVSGKAFYK
ncbi:MAG: hypothetical protein WCH58_01890 [Candidatus Saccharibacteria bacterium]